MIEYFRRRSGKKAFKVLLWATFFSLVGLSSFVALLVSFFTPTQECFIRVNQHAICQKDLDHLRFQLRGSSQEFSDELLIQRLISESLFAEASSRYGFMIPTTYAHHAFNNPFLLMALMGDYLIPELFLGGRLDRARLTKYLHQRRLSLTQFEKIFEERLLRMLMAQLFAYLLPHQSTSPDRQKELDSSAGPYIIDFLRKNVTMSMLTIPNHELKKSHD